MSQNKSPQFREVILISQMAAIGMLLWALLPFNPYGYFQILRIVVCAVCFASAYRAYAMEATGWTWTFGILAAVFNPFVPVGLTRSAWAFIDLVAAAILAASVYYAKSRKTSPPFDSH